MREKILRFLVLVGLDPNKMFDALVESLITPFKGQLDTGFQEALPEGPAKALALVEKSFKDKREDFLTRMIAIYERLITETDIDAALVFYESDTGKKILSIGPAAMSAVDELGSTFSIGVMKSIEGELKTLLGDEVLPTPQVAAEAAGH